MTKVFVEQPWMLYKHLDKKFAKFISQRGTLKSSGKGDEKKKEEKKMQWRQQTKNVNYGMYITIIGKLTATCKSIRNKNFIKKVTRTCKH